MHGGELGIEDWTARYDALEKELGVLDLPSQEEAAAMADAKELMDGSDEEEEEEEEGEDLQMVKEEDEDAEEGGNDSMVVDGEESASPSKRTKKVKKPKAKGRKSDGIDLAAADQSQMLATVDQDTLTRLRLTKKYYSDAISFIHQLDRAMDTVADLLASTVKSEVLEAMEFFKVAYEYKIEAADVSLSFSFFFA